MGGRGVYGRVVPLKPPKRGGWRLPRLSQTVWRGLGLMLGVMLLFVGLANYFAVSEIQVDTPESKSRIEATVRDQLGGRPWRSNLLMLDTDALKRGLLAADPTIKSVELSRRLPHTLQVRVVLKQPSIAWSSGNQVFVLDADGTAIGGVAIGSKLPVVVDGSNVPVEIGQRVASKRFVAFVEAVVPALTARSVGVTKLSVKDTTLDLIAETNKGYRLIFDTSREVGDEIADLEAVWRTIAAQKRSAVEYIDLRIAGKAYYK